MTWITSQGGVDDDPNIARKDGCADGSPSLTAILVLGPLVLFAASVRHLSPGIRTEGAGQVSFRPRGQTGSFRIMPALGVPMQHHTGSSRHGSNPQSDSDETTQNINPMSGCPIRWRRARARGASDGQSVNGRRRPNPDYRPDALHSVWYRNNVPSPYTSTYGPTPHTPQTKGGSPTSLAQKMDVPPTSLGGCGRENRAALSLADRITQGNCLSNQECVQVFPKIPICPHIYILSFSVQ